MIKYNIDYKPKIGHMDLKDIKPKGHSLLKALEVIAISAIFGTTAGYAGSWAHKEYKELTNSKYNSVVENVQNMYQNGHYQLHQINLNDLEKTSQKGE